MLLKFMISNFVPKAFKDFRLANQIPDLSEPIIPKRQWSFRREYTTENCLLFTAEKCIGNRLWQEVRSIAYKSFQTLCRV